MCATAAKLIERVLPQTGLRQWVLTFPFSWRRRLAQDGALLGRLTRIFAETVHAFYAERAGKGGISGAKTGSVTVVQRTSSDLRLNRICPWSLSMGPTRSRGPSWPGSRSAT